MPGRPSVAAVPAPPGLGYGATRIPLEGLPGTCRGVLAPASAAASRGPDPHGTDMYLITLELLQRCYP